MAAQYGRLEVCNTLLKFNADANAVDEVIVYTFELNYVATDGLKAHYENVPGDMSS
jgi:hypothetical protein